MPAYRKGQTVKLFCVFADAAGVAANPTTVTCSVEKPDKTETTYTASSDPPITNPETGSFQLILTVDQSGMWAYRWQGVTSGHSAVDEELMHVTGSAF